MFNTFLLETQRSMKGSLRNFKRRFVMWGAHAACSLPRFEQMLSFVQPVRD